MFRYRPPPSPWPPAPPPLACGEDRTLSCAIGNRQGLVIGITRIHHRKKETFPNLCCFCDCAKHSASPYLAKECRHGVGGVSGGEKGGTTVDSAEMQPDTHMEVPRFLIVIFYRKPKEAKHFFLSDPNCNYISKENQFSFATVPRPKLA